MSNLNANSQSEPRQWPADDFDAALQAIDAAAKLDRDTAAALKKISQARIDLVLGRDAKAVFFASVAMRLRMEPGDAGGQIDTAATDGKRIIFNPAFVADLSREEMVGLLAHEVLHVTNAHHARMGARDPQQWNIACDYAINPILRDAGLKLPSGGIFPGDQKLAEGLSAEEYYAQLSKLPPRPDGDGADPGRSGGVMTPGQGTPAEVRQAEAEAKQLAAAAEQAVKNSGRGELPSGISKQIEKLLNPAVDPRTVLREFVTKQAKNDYAWSRPNRRYVHQGLYLPGLHSEELGKVVLSVDESGSVSDAQLSIMAGWMAEILEVFPTAELVILHHDTRVGCVEEWTAADGPLELTRKCSGGTSHVDVFKVIERDHADAACVVCLTDLDTDFPSEAPALPVLWMVVGGNTSVPPFGRATPME